MLKEKYPQRIERWKQPCFSVWGLGVSLKRSGGTIFKMSSSKFLPLVHMLLLLQGLGSTQQRMWTTMCGSAGTGSKNNVGVGSCCCPANLALCCLKNHLQTGESLRVFWWKHRQEDTKPCIKSSCWGAELRGECHGDGSQSWVFFEAAFLSPSTHLILGSRRMSGRKKSLLVVRTDSVKSLSIVFRDQTIFHQLFPIIFPPPTSRQKKTTEVHPPRNKMPCSAHGRSKRLSCVGNKPWAGMEETHPVRWTPCNAGQQLDPQSFWVWGKPGWWRGWIYYLMIGKSEVVSFL